MATDVEEPPETDADRKGTRLGLEDPIGFLDRGVIGPGSKVTAVRESGQFGASHWKTLPLPPPCAAHASMPVSARRDFPRCHITAQKCALASWNSAHSSFTGFLYFR